MHKTYQSMSSEEVRKQIKTNLKRIRLERNYTQKDVAKGLDLENPNGGRTSVTNWESMNCNALPHILSLIKLCAFLEVDLDYLLGITPIESKDRQTIADTLHLSLSTVCTLCNQPDCGTFIDHLIDDAQFSALSEYSTQLAHSLLLKDIVTTSFTKAFEKRLYAHFQAYDASAAPFITKEDFAIYLKKQYPYSDHFTAAHCMNSYFLENGQQFVLHSTKDFFSLEPKDQYDHLISCIVDLSFDYYVGSILMTLSKQKMTAKLYTIIERIIEKQSQQIKENIKNTFLSSAATHD